MINFLLSQLKKRSNLNSPLHVSSNNVQVSESAKTQKTVDKIQKPKRNTIFKFGIGMGITLGIAAISSLVLFRLLNRLKIEGLENIPDLHENVLYCPNHSSLLDNFAISTALYIPRIFFRPEYIPVNLADRKNFFGNPNSRRLKDRVLKILGEYFFKNLRAFPVDRGYGGLEQVDQWVELLKSNIVIVFPEGTRSRTGKIGQGKPGVGKLIYKTKPFVIPVKLTGTDEVLGVGRLIPRIFQTVHISIGKPLNLDEFLNNDIPTEFHDQIEFYRKISNRVVGAIKALPSNGY